MHKCDVFAIKCTFKQRQTRLQVQLKHLYTYIVPLIVRIKYTLKWFNTQAHTYAVKEKDFKETGGFVPKN